MVHTAELTYSISAELEKTFINLKSSHWYSQDRIWYNGLLRDNGLVFRLKKIEAENYSKPLLVCRINFSKLLHPDDKISLMTAWDVDAVEDRFNELVKELCSELPKFNYWKVNRIDYCVNVQTPYVEQYLNLLKKGDRYYMKDTYDHNGNYGQKPGSLYMISTAQKKRNRGITVNFYNKADEVLKSYDSSDAAMDNEELENLPKDILRIEIQCHKAKTEALKKKYGMPAKNIPYFLDSGVAYDVLSYYLKKIAGPAAYHRKPVALKLIDQLGCHETTKDKMKKIIQDVARQYSSVAKVRERYISDGTMTRDEFNNLIRTLQKNDINPVTITSNLHIDGKMLQDGLKSVFELFEDAFEEEMIQEG